MKQRIWILLCVCFLFITTAYGETFAPGFSSQTIDTNVTYKSWWSPYGGAFGFADGGVIIDWSKDVNASAIIAPKAITLGDYTLTTDAQITAEGVFCVVGTRLSFEAAKNLREGRENAETGLPGNTREGNCVGGIYFKLFTGGRMGIYVSDGKAGGHYFYHEIENEALAFADRKTLKLCDTGNTITVYVNQKKVFAIRLSDLYGTNYRGGALLSADDEKIVAFSGVKIPTTGYLGFAVRGGAMQLWNTQIEGDPSTVRPTPLMGWSSWNVFGADINETKIRETADAMVRTGLPAAGYEYVNVDDGYQSRTRDAAGNVGYNHLFASGMKSLGDYIHNRGLMYGLYTANGIETCLGYPGLQYNEEKDAATYASYGIDFIKVDYCLREDISYSTAEKIYGITVNGTTYPATSTACRGGAVFDGEGIAMIEQNIGYAAFDVSVPTAGTYAVTVNYKKTAADKLPLFIRVNRHENYRVYYLPKGSTSLTVNLSLAAGKNELTFGNPIRPSNQNYDGTSLTYGFVSDCLDEAAENFAKANGQLTRQIKMEVCEWGGYSPWLWAPAFATQWRTGNDINASWKSVNDCYNHCMNFYAYAKKGAFNDPDILEVGNIAGATLAQEQTHFTLWCMMNAPLLLGNDVRTMRPEILEIVTNEDAIAINQDSRAIPCIRYLQSGGVDYLVKPLTEGRMALAMYNTTTAPVSGIVSLANVKQCMQLTDTDYYEKHFDLPDAPYYYARNVWKKENYRMQDSIFFACEPYGTCLYIIDTQEMPTENTVQFEIADKVMMEVGTSITLPIRLYNAASGETSVQIEFSVSDGFSISKPSDTWRLKENESLMLPITLTAAQGVTVGTLTMTSTAVFANGKTQTQSFSRPIYAGKKIGAGALTKGDLLYTTGGYNTVNENRSYDGNPLTIGGMVHETGIGVHAGNELAYLLHDAPYLFTATVGMDDEQAQNNNLVFEVWGDNKLLYKTDPITKGNDRQICVYLDKISCLRLIVSRGTDGNDGYDHADWIAPKLMPVPEEIKTGPLKLADAYAVWEGYGQTKQNKSIDGNPLRVSGVTYREGFGTHAAGEMTFHVGGAHVIFTAGVGIDDEVVRDYPNVDVRVYGDDTVLWETKNLCYGEKKDICVELSGYQLMRLVITDYNGTNAHDHVDILEPEIHTYRPILAHLRTESGIRAQKPQEIASIDTDVLDETADGTLFAVGYKEERLVFAQKISMETQNTPLSQDVDCVKVLLWKNGTLLPLGDSVVLENSEA